MLRDKMNASVRPDLNYCSITADGYADPAMEGKTDFSDVDGSKVASVLKISDGAHDRELKDLKVPAGCETAVDLDWAKNVRVSGSFGIPPQLGVAQVQPDNLLRLKGPFVDCAFAGFPYQKGKRNGVDIEIGDHFDQHPGLGRGWDLLGMEAHMNGDRVTVAVGWVVPFTGKYNRAHCEYLIWESLKLKAYVATKHLIRWILRIPAGTKGPSWF